jgi:hypothetical protein
LWKKWKWCGWKACRQQWWLLSTKSLSHEGERRTVWENVSGELRSDVIHKVTVKTCSLIYFYPYITVSCGQAW